MVTSEVLGVSVVVLLRLGKLLSGPTFTPKLPEFFSSLWVIKKVTGSSEDELLPGNVETIGDGVSTGDEGTLFSPTMEETGLLTVFFISDCVELGFVTVESVSDLDAVVDVPSLCMFCDGAPRKTVCVVVVVSVISPLTGTEKILVVNPLENSGDSVD